MPSALDEKLKEAIVGELKRQAADRPQTLSVSDSTDLFVNGKIDLDALIMVVAGSVAGGPEWHSPLCNEEIIRNGG